MNKFKDKRSLVAAACVSAALLVSAVLLAVNLSPSVNAVFSSGSADLARLTVNVVEGYSEAPIAGAKVVIVETGKAYETNENGMTGIIEVPFVRDTRYDRILQKPWGEVSLIIYKDGFVPMRFFTFSCSKARHAKVSKYCFSSTMKGKSTHPFPSLKAQAEFGSTNWSKCISQKYPNICSFRDS